MNQFLTQFAAEETAQKSGLAVLGLDPKALLLQLVTFVLLFLILRRFAFKKIVAMLEERQNTINKGVKLGYEMEAEKQRLDEKVEEILREGRKESEKIIAAGHVQAGEIIKEAEMTATRKASTLLTDAEAHIAEDISRARRELEKELVTLVAETTEALISEKLDSSKDTELIKKLLKKVER